MISGEEALVLSKKYSNRNDIPEVFLSGDTLNLSKDIEKYLNISFRSSWLNFEGVTEIKWQGSSSLGFPKRNFNIKLYTDSTRDKKLKVPFKNWGMHSDFTLKANYIDHSHSRNIVSARLWGEIVSTRNSIPDELKKSPNYGAIDGFPIKLYINGQYQGLYTWNIRKKDYMFNMDENNPNHAAIMGENNEDNTSTSFKVDAVVDGTDWSLEFPDVLSPDILSSFNAMISHVRDTDDATFKSDFTNYFDLEATIDYYILAFSMCGSDSLAKNLMMLTYDGIHWIPSMYDMDTSWGLVYDGSAFDKTTHPIEYFIAYHSLLWQRFESAFYVEIYDRYSQLRETVLSNQNILSHFSQFQNSIPKELIDEDVEIFPSIPSSDTDHIKQIRNFVPLRMEFIDARMKKGIVSRTADHSFNNLLAGGRIFSSDTLWNGLWDFKVTANDDQFSLGQMADRFETLGTGDYLLFTQKIKVKPDTDYCVSFYGKGISSGSKFAVVDQTNNEWISLVWSSFDQHMSDTQYNRVYEVFHTPVGCTLIEVFPFRTETNVEIDVHLWGYMVNEGSSPIDYTDW